jgi:arginyl-tRNA synthetase
MSKDHFSEEIVPILRELSFFPDVIRSASSTNSPSTVANYLLSLAQLYNSYYSENRILGTDKESEGTLLSSAVKHTIAAGLKVLGIEPVKAM